MNQDTDNSNTNDIDEELTSEAVASMLMEMAHHIDRNREELSETISETAINIYSSVQSQVEQNEKIIAQLLSAYQELTMAFETLVWKLWGDSPKDSEDFKRKLSESRNRMVNWIKGVANAGGVDEEDLARAMEQVFPTKHDSDGDNNSTASMPDSS